MPAITEGDGDRCRCGRGVRDYVNPGRFGYGRESAGGRTTVIGRPNSPLPNGFYRTRAVEQAAPGGQLTPVGDGAAPCWMTH